MSKEDELQQIINQAIIQEITRPWHTLSAIEQDEWRKYTESIANNDETARATWENMVAGNRLKEVLSDYSFFQVIEYYEKRKSDFFDKSKLERILDKISSDEDIGIEIVKKRNLQNSSQELFDAMLIQTLVKLYKDDAKNYINLSFKESLYRRMTKQIEEDRLRGVKKWEDFGFGLNKKKGAKQEKVKGIRYYSCPDKLREIFEVCLSNKDKKGMLINKYYRNRSYYALCKLYEEVEDWTSLFILEDTFGFGLANSMYEYLYKYIVSKYYKRNDFEEILNAYLEKLKEIKNPIFRLIVFEKVKYPYDEENVLCAKQILVSIEKLDSLISYYICFYKEISTSIDDSLERNTKVEEVSIENVLSSGEEYIEQCKRYCSTYQSVSMAEFFYGKFFRQNLSVYLGKENVEDKDYIKITDLIYNIL